MIAVRAHAKINLGLEVEGLRGDGYHEIRTTLQTIDLHDALCLEEAAEITLRVTGDYPVPADGSNLVVKAACALRDASAGQGRGAPSTRGARILLAKRIPPGSGLGGGSSDAAAALMGLDRLWGTGAGPEALLAIARGLGSDVPFFLYGGTCLGTGRGDEIVPLSDPPERQVLVVWTGVPLSTREVYSGLPESLTRGRNLSTMSRFNPVPASRAPGDPGSLPEFWPGDARSPAEAPRVDNDLEETSFARIPQLRRIKERLLESGAVAAAMSGSGSAIYGLFAPGEDLEPIKADVERQGPLGNQGRRVFICRTLSRATYGTRLFEPTKDFS